MTDSKETSVTDSNGEVRGWDGLYVMDGAAFPRAVGVNPSATIAAVAEFKIERFIRQKMGEHNGARLSRGAQTCIVATLDVYTRR